MNAPPLAAPAATAPLEPPPSDQPGIRTRGGRLRPAFVLALAVAIFALAWILSVAWTTGDEAIADWVNANVDEAGKAKWRSASWPGATVTLVVLTALGSGACLLVREWRAMWATGSAGVMTAGAVHFLKLLIGRDRPEGAVLDTHAFPSGHATSGMLAWGLLALVVLPALARHVRFTPLARRFAIGLWIGIAGATAAARVLGGVHWASDVIAGLAFGGAVLVVAVRAARTDRPPPPLEAPKGTPSPTQQGQGQEGPQSR